MDKELVSVIFGAIAMIMTGMGVVILWLAKTQLSDIKNYFKDITQDIRGLKLDVRELSDRTTRLESRVEENTKDINIAHDNCRDGQNRLSEIEKTCFVNHNGKE